MITRREQVKKNIIIKLAAVCSLAGALLAGCGKSSSVEVDTEALASSLASDITYSEELSQISESDISSYITMQDDVKGIMYMSSGSTAEEVAVFTAPDEATAATMKENVQEFLDDQKTSFEDYIPEAAQRVENAVLVEKGNYVVLCVSDDSDKAQDIIDKALNK